MTTRNDSTTIDALAETISRCVRGEVPDSVLYDEVERAGVGGNVAVLKAAEAKAETFLHEHTGENATLRLTPNGGPAGARHERLRAALWAIDRMLSEFPGRAIHDASFACDPESMEELCRADAALSAAGNLIAKASGREGDRGGDVQ